MIAPSELDSNISSAANRLPSLRIYPVPPTAEIEKKWRSLECRSDNSYFTSWSWIGCWLECLPPRIRPLLAEFSVDGSPVGLAILIERKYRRHLLLPVSAVFLNSTGDAVLDHIRIEYNDLLCERGKAGLLRRLLVESMLTANSQIEELVVDGTLASADWAEELPPNVAVRRNEDIGRSVDLDAVRTCGDYLSLLSPNTRSNVRRSHRDMAKLGTISLKVADSLSSARSMYSTLQVLHNKYWSSRGHPGAFANPFHRSFHAQLIERHFMDGEIQLVSMLVGEHVAGVLYNFVYRGHVYSYQSGFDYDFAGKQCRPGLVAHSLAIAHNAAAGNLTYDFMAGDSQYKRSLATKETAIHWITLQRNSFKFRLENWLRQQRRRWRNWSARSDGSSATP